MNPVATDGALFYISFVQGGPSADLALFDAFGEVNPVTDRPYVDTCGAVGSIDPRSETFAPESAMVHPTLCDSSSDLSFKQTCRPVYVTTSCMSELRTQMITYLIFKPFIMEIVIVGCPPPPARQPPS